MRRAVLCNVLVVEALAVLILVLQTRLVVCAVGAHGVCFEIFNKGDFDETLTTVANFAVAVDDFLAREVIDLVEEPDLAVLKGADAVCFSVDTHSGKLVRTTHKVFGFRDECV